MYVYFKSWSSCLSVHFLAFQQMHVKQTIVKGSTGLISVSGNKQTLSNIQEKTQVVFLVSMHE